MDPRRIAAQANGRAFGLAAVKRQSAFFDRVRAALQRPGVVPAPPAEAASGWVFEIVAIHPAYFYEANARVVPDGHGTLVDTSGFTVSPVDLAFEGVGVRWGSRRPDVLDGTTDAVRHSVRTLNPGDRVVIDGRVQPGPHEIVELTRVSAIAVRD